MVFILLYLNPVLGLPMLVVEARPRVYYVPLVVLSMSIVVVSNLVGYFVYWFYCL